MTSDAPVAVVSGSPPVEKDSDDLGTVLRWGNVALGMGSVT